MDATVEDLNAPLRIRCYGCYRPEHLCFCDQIPSIQNSTRITILQHMRERFHPFNTARIVRQALCNSTLLVDHNLQLADRFDAVPLSSKAGLLYPGGKQLGDVSKSEWPDELVIIDGTWHHAKTLVRDIPRLSEIPRFEIIPSHPGRYRIRREPTATALSTLEATVAALSALEPETAGLDELVQAFNSMVETQLAHPKADYGWRENAKRSHNPMGIPRVIRDAPENIVVAYGESEPGIAGCKRSPRGTDRRQPVYWVAKRLESGESFRRWITPPRALPDHFLKHVRLGAETWDEAVSVPQFQADWDKFLRPTDHLLVYHRSTLRLLENIGARTVNPLVLKSVNYDPNHEHATLDTFLQSHDVPIPGSEHPGRSGQRLANAIAMVYFLNGPFGKL